MKILVFIKTVPDLSVPIELDELASGEFRKYSCQIINPSDLAALEEAVSLKEKIEGSEVVAISLGDVQRRDIFTSSLAMGADQVVQVKAADGLTDWRAISHILSKAAKNIGFDLILTGDASADSNSSCVGPAAATMLELPCVAFAKKIELDSGPSALIVHMRDLKGKTQIVKCPLPALVTVSEGFNEPRYPSLPSLMAAIEEREARIAVQSADEAAGGLERCESAAALLEIGPPQKKPKKGLSALSAGSAQHRAKAVLFGSAGEKNKSKKISGGSPQAISSASKAIFGRIFLESAMENKR